MSKVSIAIATFNGSNYLREQLDSLYRQSRIPDEIVVSDDCSTDSTCDILEEYHQKYGLVYYRNETNLGFNKNFENALSHVTGDYVMICDQDDIWFENKVETLLNEIIKYDRTVPVVVTSSTLDYVEGEIVCNNSTPRMMWKHMLQGFGTQGCCSIINRSLLEKILPMDLPKGVMYDGYIGFVAGMLGEWHNIGTPLMYYRHHSNNVIANINSVGDRKNQYPGVFSSGRFDLMRLIDKRFRSEFVSERVQMFDEIIKLENKKSKLSRIFTLVKLNYVPLIKRIKSSIKIILQ